MALHIEARNKKIVEEYINGNKSFNRLSKKYGVSVATIKNGILCKTLKEEKAKELEDRKKDIIDKLKNGLSLVEIANEHGMTPQNVRNIVPNHEEHTMECYKRIAARIINEETMSKSLKSMKLNAYEKYVIERVHGQSVSKVIKKMQANCCVKMYTKNNMSQTDIADALKISSATVAKYLKAAGVKCQLSDKEREQRDKRIVKMYQKGKVSFNEIALKENLTSARVQQIINDSKE